MSNKLKDAMNSNFAVINKDTVCKEARKYIFTLDSRSIFIVDKKKLIGIVTDGDFLIKEHNIDDPVSKIMSSPVLTIMENSTLQEAAKILTNHRINQLAVVNLKHEMIGLITERDIVKDLIVDTRQPKLSPERAAIYLSMTNEREKEEYWVNKINDEGFKCVVTQVGATADKIALKLREAAIVAAIANDIIQENLEDKIALSSAVRDAYSQLALINPGLGGGFKMAVVRSKRLIVVACFGRCGHALANGPNQLVLGFSVI